MYVCMYVCIYVSIYIESHPPQQSESEADYIHTHTHTHTHTYIHITLPAYNTPAGSHPPQQFNRQHCLYIQWWFKNPKNSIVLVVITSLRPPFIGRNMPYYGLNYATYFAVNR